MENTRFVLFKLLFYIFMFFFIHMKNDGFYSGESSMIYPILILYVLIVNSIGFGVLTFLIGKKKKINLLFYILNEIVIVYGSFSFILVALDKKDFKNIFISSIPIIALVVIYVFSTFVLQENNEQIKSE